MDEFVQPKYREAIPGFVWTEAGINLIRENLNAAVTSAQTFGELLQDLAYLDLLEPAAFMKLQQLFLDQPYSKMGAMPTLNITVTDCQNRINSDFAGNPIAAWEKHGLEPITQGVIYANTMTSACQQLVRSLQGASIVQIESHRPLIKALQAEHDIIAMQEARWMQKSIYDLGEDQEAFLKHFKGFVIVDPRRVFWQRTALDHATPLTFSVLWNAFRSYFEAGLLNTAQFRDKFIRETAGMPLGQIVNGYGFEWLDPKRGLVTLQDLELRQEIGRYLVDVIELPYNFEKASPTVAALQKHGFFNDHNLIMFIKSGSEAVIQAKKRYQEETERNKESYDSSVEHATSQYNTAIAPAEAEALSQYQRVERYRKTVDARTQLDTLRASLPALEQALKEAQDAVKAALAAKPEGDILTIEKMIELRKATEALETLKEQLSGAAAASRASRDKAASDTTAFEAIGNAFKGKTKEETALSELESKINEAEKAERMAKITYSREKKYDIDPEITTTTLLHQLAALRHHRNDLKQKQDLLDEASTALKNCKNQIDSLLLSGSQSNPDSLESLKRQFEEAQKDSVAAQRDLATVLQQAKRIRNYVKQRAEDELRRSNEGEQLILDNLIECKQNIVDSEIRYLYGLERN